MLLNADQIGYAQLLAKMTGLRPETIGAWMLAEEPASRDPIAQGHNWLNLLSHDAYAAHGNRTYSGVPVAAWTARFARFYSVHDAAKEASVWINDFSNYAGIRASRGKSALDQVNAIAASPWDAGHYGGNGSSIRATLREVEDAHIFGHSIPHHHPTWVVRIDGKIVARTKHPKRWVAAHYVFSRGAHVHFDQEPTKR